MSATYILQENWVGNSGQSYQDFVIFKKRDDVVFVNHISADADGKVLSSIPDRAYRIDKARRYYKQCLDDGCKPIHRLPSLTYRTY